MSALGSKENDIMERHIRRMMHDIKKRRTYDELKALKRGRAEKHANRNMDKPPSQDEPRDLDETDWDEVDEIEQRGRARPKRSRKRKPRPTGSSSEESFPRRNGIVFTTRKKRIRASVGGKLVTCWLTADLAADQKRSIAVGDEVVIEDRGADQLVVEVLPRRTTLSRPDPFDATLERVVAANVDVVVQVSAVRNPPLRPGLIDRYLIAIERGNAEPVICINKIDLLEDDERPELEKLLAEYSSIDIPLIRVSTKSGEGIDELRQLVIGRTAVLVGHSGVGKSSILNALDSSLRLVTAELHKEGNAGRHTTSSSTLYEFADGTRLIDTPGIREFGLWEMTPEELRLYFPEFAEIATRCRYRNCTHMHEPECAIKHAAAEGKLPRYERYRRMAADTA